MAATSVICLTEGFGDREALPILVRRIANAYGVYTITILPSIRVPRSALTNVAGLTRHTEFAANKVGANGAVLVVFDADEDCPAELAVRLLPAARSGRADVAVGLVLAKHEFETWFIAAAESIAGRRGLPADFRAPESPEAIRAPKEWLSQQMGRERGYKETTDQPALAAIFDIALARGRSDSFDKFCREVERLIGAGG